VRNDCISPNRWKLAGNAYAPIRASREKGSKVRIQIASQSWKQESPIAVTDAGIETTTSDEHPANASRSIAESSESASNVTVESAGHPLNQSWPRIWTDEGRDIPGREGQSAKADASIRKASSPIRKSPSKGDDSRRSNAHKSL
jgi:hypothetical protein